MIFGSLLVLYYSIVLVNGASYRQGVLQEICKTKECYYAAEHIKKWMNPAFKPCEDFYEFSCGYWHSPDNKTENKQHSMSLGSRGDFFELHLKTFLLDETIDRESNVFKMMKDFLNMCLDEDQIESRGVLPAIEYLRKAGGWPVLEETWSEDNWNILNTEMFFGGIFFQFEIQPRESDNIWSFVIQPKYNTDEIFEDLADGFQKESVQKYYKNKCKLAETFGADRNRTQEEMRDTLEFEIAMSELEKGLNDSEEYEIYNMSQLQNQISWVNWTLLFSSLLPEPVALPENVTVTVISPNFLRELGNVINSYPKRTIANYMMSKAAPPLKKYLPSWVYNITGDVKDSRFETCVEIIKSSSFIGISAAYIARQTVDDTRVATEMTQRLLEELLIDVQELDWLDEKTRSIATKTLKETKLFISFPDQLFNLDTVEDVYKEVKITSNNFFESAMESRKWKRMQDFRLLGKSTREIDLQKQITDAMTINAYFRIGANHIVVTAGFLHYLPLFSSKVPNYVNYGHLGGIIAHELTHALDFQTDDPEDDTEDSKVQYQLYKWGSDETEEIYDEKKQCIIDQYSSFNDTKYTGKTLIGWLTAREDVADNGGLKLSLRAYRRLAEQIAAPEPKLPGLQQYSVEQLFMISAANPCCEIPTKEKLLAQMEYDSHSPFEFRIKGMMMNSPDFSLLFACDESDPMNPSTKCEVW